MDYQIYVNGVYNSGGARDTHHVYHEGNWYLKSNFTTANPVITATHYSTGNKVGIGNIVAASIAAQLHVKSLDATYPLILAGTTKGLRVRTTAAGSFIEGVDQTGVTSYQPIDVNGSVVSFSIDGTEKSRFSSNGQCLFGTTSTLLNSRITMYTNLSTENGIGILDNTNQNTGKFIYFTKNDTAVLGSITNNTNTGILYNTTSDSRLKENIANAASASSVIDGIQVRTFDWKDDGPNQRFGMIAQELIEIAPEAVYAPSNPDEMMSIDYSKLVPMIIKELQELRSRVAYLENN